MRVGSSLRGKEPRFVALRSMTGQSPPGHPREERWATTRKSVSQHVDHVLLVVLDDCLIRSYSFGVKYSDTQILLAGSRMFTGN